MSRPAIVCSASSMTSGSSRELTADTASTNPWSEASCGGAISMRFDTYPEAVSRRTQCPRRNLGPKSPSGGSEFGVDASRDVCPSVYSSPRPPLVHRDAWRTDAHSSAAGMRFATVVFPHRGADSVHGSPRAIPSSSMNWRTDTGRREESSANARSKNARADGVRADASTDGSGLLPTSSSQRESTEKANG